MKKFLYTLTALAAAFLAAPVISSCMQSGAKNQKDDLSHHVIITYMTTGDRPTNGATEKMLKELNKILTEKVNAELQIFYIPWNDYLVNYNMCLSQLDGSVDLVGTASDWLDAWNNIKNGTFLGMSDEMVKKYAPKTYESVSAEHWEMCRMNGKLYMLPEDNYAQWINHGFIYRSDWAKEAGLSNGVHSWEELTSYLEYVAKSKPGIIPWNSDGGLDTYHPEGYIESKSDYVPLEGISTNLYFGVHRNNLSKVYSPFIEGNELVEYAKLMKRWNEIGVWPKDLAQSVHSKNREEFKVGKVAVEEHHTQTWYTEVRPALQKNVPGADCEFFWFGEEAGNITAMTVTHGAMAVSAASPNPERALMVYDLLRNDPECYRLLNYGIEGVQYVLTGDGYRDTPPSYDPATQKITTNYWWGRNDNLEVRDKSGSWDKFEEKNAIYGKHKIDYPYPKIVWDISNIGPELAELNNVWGTYMGNICYGREEDVEAYVEEFRRACKKAGIEKVIAELQRQVDAANK